MNFSQLQGVQRESSRQACYITNMLQDWKKQSRLPIVYIHPPERHVPSTESCYEK